MTQNSHANREMINKFDYIEIHFYIKKNTTIKAKRKTFATYITGIGLISYCIFNS